MCVHAPYGNQSHTLRQACGTNRKWEKSKLKFHISQVRLLTAFSLLITMTQAVYYSHKSAEANCCKCDSFPSTKVAQSFKSLCLQI